MSNLAGKSQMRPPLCLWHSATRKVLSHDVQTSRVCLSEILHLTPPIGRVPPRVAPSTAAAAAGSQTRTAPHRSNMSGSAKPLPPPRARYHAERIREVFNQIDKTGDDALSFLEIKKGLEESDVDWVRHASLPHSPGLFPPQLFCPCIPHLSLFRRVSPPTLLFPLSPPSTVTNTAPPPPLLLPADGVRPRPGED
jgi:hypothetical protein